MILFFRSCDLVMWEEVSIFAIQNLLAMSFIFPSSDKIQRYHEYLQQLQEDSKPCRIDPDLFACYNQADSEEISTALGVWCLPLQKVLCRIYLFNYLSTIRNLTELESINNKAKIEEIYHALSLCDEDVRWHLLSQVAGTLPDVLKTHFDKGEECFCEYLKNNAILKLNGLQQWAWYVNFCESIITWYQTPQSLSPDQDDFIVNHPDRVFPFSGGSTFRERLDYVQNMIAEKKIDTSIWVQDILDLCPRYWEIAFDKEVDKIVMSIVERPCKIFPEGSFLPYYMEALDTWKKQQDSESLATISEQAASKEPIPLGPVISYIGVNKDLALVESDMMNFVQELVSNKFLEDKYKDSLCYRLFGIHIAGMLEDPILFEEKMTYKDLFYIIKKLTTQKSGPRSSKYELAKRWFALKNKNEDNNFQSKKPQNDKDASQEIKDIVDKYFNQGKKV